MFKMEQKREQKDTCLKSRVINPEGMNTCYGKTTAWQK